MNNIYISASQEAKATIQQQVFCIGPPPKKKKVCPQSLGSGNITDGWGSEALVGLSKIQGRRDAPFLYAFLNDCAFSYVYYRAGNSTEPETVAD